MKPFLFLDVDDVLNVKIAPYQEHLIEVVTADMPRHAFISHFSEPTVTLSVCFPNRYEAWLAELAEVYELVWATTWEHLANRHLAPLLGLDPLPVVEFTEPPRFSEVKHGDPAPWKWRHLVEYASGRPFVFVDDGALVLSLDYPLAAGCAKAALFVEYGLQRSDVDRLLDFAATLAS